MVTTLSLAINYLGDEGVSAIASALHDNAALTKLNLKNNSVGSAGAKALASALKAGAHGAFLSSQVTTGTEARTRDGPARPA